MKNEMNIEKWEEICFILSEKITRDISEKDFENQVIRSIEKLGWSEFRKEIERQPVLQLGRKRTIRPDIVIYGSDRKAIVVIEVKKPAEDLAKDDSAGQLKSYMRQMKSDFGLLIGKEIRIYYDGDLNPQPEPLLLDKINFERKSENGIRFVAIFNREDFLKSNYESFLNNLIDQHKAKRNIKKLKKNLVTEETKKKIFQFLKNEYSDYGSDIIQEALKALNIDLYLKPSGTAGVVEPSKGKKKHPDTPMGIRETVFYIIKASKNGIGKIEIINNTKYEKRQVSNALHRLSKLELIEPKSRGIWIAIKEYYTTKRVKQKKSGLIKAPIGKPLGNHETVFNAIKKYRKGTTFNKLTELTGLEPKQIRNALYRLNKRGRIRSLKPGIYIALE